MAEITAGHNAATKRWASRCAIPLAYHSIHPLPQCLCKNLEGSRYPWRYYIVWCCTMVATKVSQTKSCGSEWASTRWDQMWQVLAHSAARPTKSTSNGLKNGAHTYRLLAVARFRSSTAPRFTSAASKCSSPLQHPSPVRPLPINMLETHSFDTGALPRRAVHPAQLAGRHSDKSHSSRRPKKHYSQTVSTLQTIHQACGCVMAILCHCLSYSAGK